MSGQGAVNGGQDYGPTATRHPGSAGSRFGIQYTTIYCGASVSFAVMQGKFTGEYVASP